MRKIILDTETSGLDPKKDKIIEIGCVELINDVPSGKTFHRYYNPGNTKISEQSENIHGLSNSFLEQFNLFDDCVDEVLDFLGDSLIIMHNAQFDVSMLNSSLERVRKGVIESKQYVCTLVMARKKFPGSKVNLNALCRRFGISLEHREKHDAITDCFLLAQVYLELIGGKQHKFNFNNISEQTYTHEQIISLKNQITPLIELTDLDIEEHNKTIKKIKNPIWNT